MWTSNAHSMQRKEEKKKQATIATITKTTITM